MAVRLAHAAVGIGITHSDCNYCCNAMILETYCKLLELVQFGVLNGRSVFTLLPLGFGGGCEVVEMSAESEEIVA